MAETFLAQIGEKLVNQLSNLTDDNELFSFDGNSSEYKRWIKTVEKKAILGDVSDKQKKFLAFKASTGNVSDFIHRYIENYPEVTWAEFKNALFHNFGEVSDQYFKFKQLRTIKQNEQENVQVYAQRLSFSAEEAFENFDINDHIIQFLMVGIYADGLKDKAIKNKIIRQNPKLFLQAVNLAVTEQNLFERFKLRSKASADQDQASGASNQILPEAKASHYHDQTSGVPDQTLPEANLNKKAYTDHDQFLPEVGSIRQASIDNDQNFKENVKFKEPDLKRSYPRFFCNYCGKRGHTILDCFKKTKADRNSFRPRLNMVDKSYRNFPKTKLRCWFCNNEGHIKINCKEWQKLHALHVQNKRPLNLNVLNIMRSILGTITTRDQ